MRHISPEQITETVAHLCLEANFDLPSDVLTALEKARDAEESEIAKGILEQLLQNAHIAECERIAICQDCGAVVVFVKLGRDIHLTGDLYHAINEGVRQAYSIGWLRKSMIREPLHRNTNTGDNTPAIIHLHLVDGDNLEITVAPKGGGSENMSALWMLTPAEGREGVINRVVERIRHAGGKPCPPLILGIGIGGTADKAMMLAKEALLRSVDSQNPDPAIAQLELEILNAVNAIGVGPMGLGGKTTALAVHIEQFPCHIASLPVALNVQCHAARHATAII